MKSTLTLQFAIVGSSKMVVLNFYRSKKKKNGRFKFSPFQK
jgi:hypothetical protein